MTIQTIDTNKPYSFDGNKIFIDIDYLSQNYSGIMIRYDLLSGIFKEAADVNNNIDNDTIIDFLIQNKTFLNYIYNLVKIGVYNYDIQLYSSKNLKQRTYLSIGEITNRLKGFKLKKPIIEKIEYLKNSPLSKKIALNEKIIGNFKYKEFLKMLMQSPEEFKKQLDNNVYGVSIKDLANIAETVNWDEFTKGIVEENNRKTIKENVHYLLYNYQEYEEMNDKFMSNKGEVDAFNLNTEIMKIIKEDMLDDYNQTERIYHAYRKICQMFSYNSKTFYSPTMNNHNNPSDLSNKKPSDLLVCNEITMIFCKYLESEGVDFRLINKRGENAKEYATHFGVMFKTDEMIITADPVYRIVKNDISRSKYLYPSKNFNVYGNNVKAKEDLERYKKRVDANLKGKYVSKDHKKIVELLKMLNAAQKDKLNVRQKIHAAIAYIRANPLPILDKAEWLDLVKQNFFNPEENYFDAEMIYEVDEKGYRQLVVYVCMNENGIDDIENNKYIIIKEGKIKEVLTPEEFKEKLNNNEYDRTSIGRKIPGIDNLNNNKERQK